MKDVTNIDGKGVPKISKAVDETPEEPEEEDQDNDEKERHSSGESVDSVLSMSLASSSGSNDVIGGRSASAAVSMFTLFRRLLFLFL